MTTPRRVCFDTASSYFLSPEVWLDGPAEARAHFKDQAFQFWAASAFDEATHQYHGFQTPEDLLTLLRDADEIVTFNGRKCDLIVMEKLVGRDATRALWRKPHHDLTGWRNHWSLSSATANLLPNHGPAFEAAREKRRADLTASATGGTVAWDDTATFRDMWFTYALFQEYLKSGDTDRTFDDKELASR
jgi:hypothetical protein